ncbi:Hexanoyl-CoA synthase [Linum perenne]
MIIIIVIPIIHHTETPSLLTTLIEIPNPERNRVKQQNPSSTMGYKSLDSISVSDIQALGIEPPLSEKLHSDLAEIVRNQSSGGSTTWTHISGRLLNPSLPFSFHQMMYYGCFLDFGPDPPAWSPDPENAIMTNVGQLLERRGEEFLGSKYKDPISSFSDFQEFSVSNPEVYWKTVFDEMEIMFSVSPESILHESTTVNPGGEWLPGAYLNPAKSCLSCNRKRTLDDVVLRWRDEGSDDLPVCSMTLEELRQEVWLVAYALDALGLEKGLAIAIDMPMNVKSVIVYLAIVMAGYVVVSIADSFASTEISTRLKISKAKAIFTQDLIIRGDKSIPLYSRVVDAQAPMAVVIPATEASSFTTKLRDGDISWHYFLEREKDSRGNEYSAVEQPVDAFTNILFSSGTTGEPKAIPWTQATPLKSAADAWCHMDIRKGDVVAWPTNLGWMMGPWLVYASLLNGASIALYNGSPLGSSFAKFVQDARVTMLGVIPSIVRVWKSSNVTAGYDWSSIRCFGSTGEASSVDEYLWLMGRANYKPVMEYCGGTEIGGGFVTGSMLQPQSLAAFSTPAMGCRLYVLDDNGLPIPRDAAGIGELALGSVMFGASTTLLNADHYSVYFKGMPSCDGKVLRRHGDFFERTSRGYYRAHGRADDTMNLGGIKVSSVEIERICNAADEHVLETAAIGVPPQEGGPERLVIAVVLKSSDHPQDSDQLKKSFNLAVQKNLNPLFRVHQVVPVASLPRTATNKVMRRVLRQQFSAQQDRNPKL